MTPRASSYRRTCVVREGQLTAPAGDLVPGDPVVVYGVGPLCALTTPSLPTFNGPPDETRLVRYALMSDACGCGPASPPVLAPTLGDVTWAQGFPGARWVVAWTSVDGGASWSTAGVCLANPRGLGILSGLTVSMSVGAIAAPEWVPDEPPNEPTRDRLAATVVSVNDTVSLDVGIDADDGTEGLLCYDASTLIAGDIPPGRFACHTDVMVGGIGQHIEGAGARWGDGLYGASELVFEGGRGLCVCGVDTAVTSITISQRDQWPALNVAAPSRSSARWFHGAGVLVERRSSLTRIRIDRASGSGLAIVAGAGGFDENANLSRMDQVRVTSCTGHGIFVDGSDANAGTFIGADAVGCGGWGVLDESLLGNTWVAPHTSANAQGAYKIESGSVLHPYSESGVQQSSEFGANCVVLGGTHGATPTGPATRVGRSQLWAEFGTANERTTFGHHVSAYSNLLRRYDGAKLRHHRRSSNGAIEDYTGNTGYTSRRWLSGHERGYGMLQFPRGVLLGDALLASVTPGDMPRGTYAPGDVLFHAQTGAQLHPAEPFGIGPEREAKRVYRIGDVVTQSGQAFVCSWTAAPFGSLSLDGSMQLTDGVQDGDVVWSLWGPGEERWI